MSSLRLESTRYAALAADGDGTLPRGGHFARATEAALLRFHQAEKRLFLTTGETTKDLAAFPHLELFDLVIAENGALLYDPATGKQQLLAHPRRRSLLRALRSAKVQPLKKGRVIICSENSQEGVVAKVLQALDSSWQIIRNRKQIMLLPKGIDKATGLSAALQQFELADCNVIAIGDAENDIPLFEFCRCGVAVANAIPALKKKAVLTTQRGAGAGVVELIETLLENGAGR